MRTLLNAVAVVGLVVLAGQGQEKKDPPKTDTPKKDVPKKPAPKGLPPTVAAFKYGEHERQVLDFWQAKSDTPTPVVLMIHGGGWQNGDKAGYVGAAKAYLDVGISVAAINYRYVKQAAAANIEPPVKAPLEDAARALQTIRSKAKEWNIDKKRIGATGGSAGACTSLWLAFHEDMANPKSEDPIARESTRLYCAAVIGAQVSLDPKELREWIPNYGYGAHAFNLKGFQELFDKREQVIKWIKEYSPIEHLSKDDPPIFLQYSVKGAAPKVGTKQDDPTHSAVMGIKLQERCKTVGVECLLVYPGVTDVKYKNVQEFLIDRLRK